MNEKLSILIDAFEQELIGEGDLLPLMGQIEARRKQARYDAVDKAAAMGVDVVTILESEAKK